MLRWSRVLINILIVVFFLEILLIFPGRIKEVPVNEGKSRDFFESERFSFRLKDIHMVESSRRQRDWEVFSKEALGVMSTGDWEMNSVLIHSYNQNFREFEMSGEKGRVDGKTKDMEIRGGVQTRSANGYVLKNESVVFSAARKEIVSPNAVRLTGPPQPGGLPLTAKADSLKISLETGLIDLVGNFRAVHSYAGKKVEIEADRGQVSGRGREVNMRGGVRLKQGTALI
ncbi:MAG: LPS export ABC transporter periplasmic protein LptC, partial [Bdellovibrionaceae bacterium]|nr:LPS export ABC transporter periplasmic protein LptC [Pseudobdellovibrionaceae bacterium]